MTRRARTSAADNDAAESAPPRLAAPDRKLVSLTPSSGLAASALATTAALGLSPYGPAAAAGSAAAIAAVFGARAGDAHWGNGCRCGVAAVTFRNRRQHSHAKE